MSVEGFRTHWHCNLIPLVSEGRSDQSSDRTRAQYDVLQAASPRADVVNGRGVCLLQLRWVNLVVRGNGSVNAEGHWLRLAGQVGDAERSPLALDARLRDINDVTHGHSFHGIGIVRLYCD